MSYLNFALATFLFVLFSNCHEVDFGTPQFERLLAQIFPLILISLLLVNALFPSLAFTSIFFFEILHCKVQSDRISANCNKTSFQLQHRSAGNNAGWDCCSSLSYHETPKSL
jgi:hypothetical protein